MDVNLAMKTVNAEIAAWGAKHELSTTPFRFLTDLKRDERSEIEDQADLANFADELGKLWLVGMLGAGVLFFLPEIIAAIAGGSTIVSLAAVLTVVKVYVVASVIPVSCFAFAECQSKAVREYAVMTDMEFRTFAKSYFYVNENERGKSFLTRKQACDKELHRLFHKWKGAKIADQATLPTQETADPWLEWSSTEGAQAHHGLCTPEYPYPDPSKCRDRSGNFVADPASVCFGS